MRLESIEVSHCNSRHLLTESFESTTYIIKVIRQYIPPLFYPTQLSTGSPSNNLTVKTHYIKHPANSI